MFCVIHKMTFVFKLKSQFYKPVFFMFHHKYGLKQTTVNLIERVKNCSFEVKSTLRDVGELAREFFRVYGF
jgi:hypothetical protein